MNKFNVDKHVPNLTANIKVRDNVIPNALLVPSKVILKGAEQSSHVFVLTASTENSNDSVTRYEVSKNEYLKAKTWSQGVNKPVLQEGKYVLIAIDKVLPAGPKELKEARGAFTAAYQEYLEKQWVDELKAKYPVKVNNEVLYSIKTKPSFK